MIQTRKPALRFALTLFITLSTALAQAKTDPADKPLTGDPTLSKTAIEVVNDLETRHYNKQILDDALSSQLLDAYLKSLDGSRLFLLQSDVDSFAKYRTTLDDTLRKGDLDPGFVIFRRYQERLIQRLEKTVATLPQTIAAMDFTKDESLDLERDKNPKWPQTEAEADELWRLRLKSTVLSLRLAGKKPEDLVKLLEKRYRSQITHAKQYSSDDVFQIYINALTSLYDPHTNYFSPRSSKNFTINMSLKLEGIGAVLRMEDDYIKVASLVPASPADKQGELKPADRIVGVGEGKNGEIKDVVGWRLDDVVDLIRGKKGSMVRLEVIPATAKSDAEHKIIAIVRNEITLEDQSAQKRVLNLTQNGRPVKIGVINVPAFYMDFDAMRAGDADYKSTTRDVEKLLYELMNENVSGVIIDLRENGGGSLIEANSLIGLFIDSGPTVQIRESSTRVSQEGKPRRSPYYDGPLAVMTNRLSASASEIFAGAIQDYQRGIILGDQTFGKGTVQQLMELQHGSLKLTQSKFYRISGESTQHRGVMPDVAFPSRYDPKEVGESALDKAMPWDRISPVQHRVYFDLQPILPSLRAKHDERVKADPDFIYMRAQLAAFEEARKHTQLSLNEAVRKREMAEEKTKALDMENKRRVAKGEKPLAKLDEPDDDDEDLPPTKKDKDKEKPDPMLMEAGRVLIDAMPVYQRQAIVERYGN